MRWIRSSTQTYGQQPGRGPQGLTVALALFSEAKSAMEIGWADASYAYAALVSCLLPPSFRSPTDPRPLDRRPLRVLGSTQLHPRPGAQRAHRARRLHPPNATDDERRAPPRRVRLRRRPRHLLPLRPREPRPPARLPVPYVPVALVLGDWERVLEFGSVFEWRRRRGEDLYPPVGDDVDPGPD